MESWTLVIIICMPGAWDSCSNGLKQLKVHNIPTLENCIKAKIQYKETLKYFVNGQCIRKQS